MYAVKQGQLLVMHTRRRKSTVAKGTEYISENDSSDEEQRPKAKRCSVLEEIKGLRKDIQGVMSLTENSKLPPGLKGLLINTFKCSICHCAIKPPVSFTRCCLSIVGCEQCVDQWYGGEEGRTKSCPLCRRERACSETCRLNGLSDFLEAIQVFFSDNTSPAASPAVLLSDEDDNLLPEN